jgi:hypothetical protein
MTDEVLAWFKAFGLTAALEVPIVVIAYGRTRAAPRTAVRVGLALFAQLASHPAVWFVFPRLGMSYIVMVAWAEAWAVLSETAFYALTFGAAAMAARPAPATAGEKRDPDASTARPTDAIETAVRAFSIALLANGVSFTAGLLLRELTGWV